MAKPQSFTVLIATDGSDEATAAVNAVNTFPWPVATRVHGVIVRTLIGLGIPDSVREDVERTLAGVAEGARKILSRRRPDTQVRVVNGPTVDAILEQAERVRARVIVLGSAGHGPIARLLLGSTSLGCVRGMKRAALVVRGRSRGWARVVLAFDGSPGARHAATFLAGLEVPAGGRVTIVSVLDRIALPSLALMPEATRSVLAGEAAAAEAESESKARRGIDAASAELARAGWKVDVVIRRGAALRELLDATEKARAQLLAVGARGHGAVEHLLLGSVAEGALHHSPVPVLVVR